MKVINAEYIPELGVSVVALQDRNNIYEACVELAEEDKDVASSFAGCQFAEYKARLKAYKKRVQEARADFEALSNLYENLTQLKYYQNEKHSQTHRFLRKQLAIKKTKFEELQEEYNYLKESYPIAIEKRLNSARQIKNILNNKEERKLLMEEMSKLYLKEE